jgi:motility quorum-sensing regulator/GCU-specific mRNA interferase toxin
MEKSTPHCKLSVIKTLIGARKIRATFSALAGGEALVSLSMKWSMLFWR